MCRFLLLLAAFALLTGCSKNMVAERDSYLFAYHSGEIKQAEHELSALIMKELPQNSYVLSKQAGWLLLDRATVRFAEDFTEGAVEDFNIAIKAIDYYKKDLPVEQAYKLLLQDDASVYQAADYEQVLACVYMSFALIHRGDEANAFALLRRVEEYQQEKMAFYANVPITRDYKMSQNGLSKYLFALLLEKKGDLSNAKILYKQAADLIPSSCEATFEPSSSPAQAKVIVICHNGNVPYKVSTIAPASQASALALEIILAQYGMRPSCSTLPGIPVPALRRGAGSYPIPTFAALDDCLKPLLPYYSVAKAARDELEQKMPLTIARGAARLILRRAAVAYLEKQNVGVGAIADCAMLIANSNTTVDTRSWSTLPAFIDVARFDVEAGCHTLTVKVEGESSKTIELSLRPSDLCIVHIFNIHPGIRRILVPTRHLANPGAPL